jgi:hypothetical protein
MKAADALRPMLNGFEPPLKPKNRHDFLDSTELTTKGAEMRRLDWHSRLRSSAWLSVGSLRPFGFSCSTWAQWRVRKPAS